MPLAVEAGYDERHLGVARPRGGVGEARRRRLGAGRIRDVAGLDASLVDAGDEQSRAVGGPPVAVAAAHLLRSDELGEPVAHPFRLRGEDLGVAAGAFEVDDAHAPLRRVRDAVPRRVGARVEHPPGGLEALHGPARERGDVEAAADLEGHLLEDAVGGEADYPRGRLARPLAPRPLLRRELVDVTATHAAGARTSLGSG